MIVVPRIQKISLSLFEFFIVIIVIVTSAINRATFMISREVNASLCAVPRLVQGSTDELISLAVLSLTARSTNNEFCRNISFGILIVINMS